MSSPALLCHPLPPPAVPHPTPNTHVSPVAVVRVRIGEVMQAMKLALVPRGSPIFSQKHIQLSHLCPSFLCVFSLLTPSFRFTTYLKSFLSSRLITINHDFHLRLIQTLFLHLSRSTLLSKTLTIDHYPRIDYFQQSAAVLNLTRPSLDTACNLTYTL